MYTAVRNTSALAGYQQTQGETEVLQALRKVYEKLHRLENDRLLSKQVVDSMATQTEKPANAGEFLHRLSTAEARCQLLEEQLSHIKNILTEINLDQIDSSFSKNFSNESQEELDLQLPPVSLFLQHLQEQARYSDLRNFHSTTATNKEKMMNTQRYSESILNNEPIVSKEPTASRERARQNTQDSAAFFRADVPSINKFSYSLNRNDDFKSYEAPVIEPPIGRTSTLMDTTDTTIRTGRRTTKKPRRVRKKGLPIPLLDTSLESETVASESCIEPTKTRERSRHSSRREKNSRQEAKLRSGISASQNSAHPNSKPSGKSSNTSAHYHVNLTGMPFVTGTATTKSHSLRANIQTLHSMVKYCNPALCSAAPFHRQRSSSLDRPSRKPMGSLNRWNSISDIGGRRQRCRSCSADRITNRITRGCLPAKEIFSDLDTVPVKLSPKHSSTGGHVHLVHCDGHSCDCNNPGKVCIKTELKSHAEGQQRVLEVKMSTPTSPRSARHMTQEQLPENHKRKQLLQDLRNLHFYLQQD